MKIEKKPAGQVDLQKMQEGMQAKQRLLSTLSNLMTLADSPHMPKEAVRMAGMISQELGNSPEQTADLMKGMLDRSSQATLNELRNLR